MTNVRIGVIGAGVLGSYHIGKCLGNSDVVLCGFHDSNVARRREVMERFSVKAYDDPDELIGGVDAAIIATPCSTHWELAMRCLRAGKHLLIEKPLAASRREGLDLVHRAEEAGVVLHVGHSEAFNAAFTKLLSFGCIPRFIEVHRLSSYSPRGTDVSVILDLMVHDLQLIVRLCKEEPLYHSIAATGVPVISDDIDIANVRIPFPSGCVANLTASRISAKRMRKIRIFSKDNYFSVDLDKNELDRYFLTSPLPRAGEPPVACSKETVVAADALESELKAFVGAIGGVSQSQAVTGREALVILKITDVILQLLAAGKMS